MICQGFLGVFFVVFSHGIPFYGILGSFITNKVNTYTPILN